MRLPHAGGGDGRGPAAAGTVRVMAIPGRGGVSGVGLHAAQTEVSIAAELWVPERQNPAAVLAVTLTR